MTGWIVGVTFGFLLGVLSTAVSLFAAGLVGLAFLLGVLDDHGRVGPALKGGIAFLLLALFLRASLEWPDLGTWSPGWFGLGGAGAGSPGGAAQVGDPLRWTFVLLLAGALQLAFQVFDNLDGVAGATVLIGSLHLAAGAGSSEFAVLGLIGAGATLGFLGWNRPPAGAYLGNAGSQALGLLAAGLVGAALLRSDSPRAGLGVILPFAWPLLDLGFVVLRRLGAGRRPWVGGRDHSTHILARRLGGDLPAFLAVLLTSTLLAVGVRVLALR